MLRGGAAGAGLGAHLVLLILAASRTALAMSAAAVLVLVCFYLERRLLAAALVGFSVLGGAVPDGGPQPGTLVTRSRAAWWISSSAEERPQSINSLTGRTDLWDAVWVEVHRSPLLVHATS